MNELVKAIREDKKVGLGSCTTIDETYTDAELTESLDADNVRTPAAAVRWAREREGLQIENATNYRWGEDSDPEIARLREWETA